MTILQIIESIEKSGLQKRLLDLFKNNETLKKFANHELKSPTKVKEIIYLVYQQKGVGRQTINLLSDYLSDYFLKLNPSHHNSGRRFFYPSTDEALNFFETINNKENLSLKLKKTVLILNKNKEEIESHIKSLDLSDVNSDNIINSERTLKIKKALLYLNDSKDLTLKRHCDEILKTIIENKD